MTEPEVTVAMPTPNAGPQVVEQFASASDAQEWAETLPETEKNIMQQFLAVLEQD